VSKFLAILLLAMSIIAPSQAAEDRGQLVSACENLSGETNQEVRIAACTMLIDGDDQPGPTRAKTYINRAWPLGIQGRYDLALRDYDKAIKLNPKYAVAYNDRGVTFLRMGRLDRAIADYDQALHLDPNTVFALYGRGIAKIRKGDSRGGLADIAAAREKLPNIDGVFEKIGLHP